ncbi:ester cyclase [Streptomyces cavernicola]|uniref:Ester cyclase n=1 Tax=Streptomyces cavernicola TaxID=3043613 RepID=A0ABT6SDC4_9ACTN|nr:ester cyclase [Streptomyces sp. B-S-A6]MDI3405473.1 ester cyclase [Streptomyces sp. B-S-A6]
MTFVQLIDCKTHDVDRLNRLMDNWVVATQGKRTATHSIVGRDRSDSTHVVEIVEFPSYEEAQKNSNLPETNRIFEEMVAACDGMPTFTDLDVVRDEQLNKAVVTRLFEEAINGNNLDLCDELCTADYREHSAGRSSYDLDLAQARRENQEHLDAFSPRMTVESMVAEGDMVCCRVSIQGRHVGAFRGIEPTGKDLTGTGQATFRCLGGKIAEGWLNFDDLGLAQQLGMMQA